MLWDFCSCLPLVVDWNHVGNNRFRCSLPWYLLCGRALSLCDGGWNIDGIDGGLYYWFPKMFGKMFSEYFARLSLYSHSSDLTSRSFLSLSWVRRVCFDVFDYLPEYASLNRISTMVHGWLQRAFDQPWCYYPWIFKKAPANPLGGAKTLEWTVGCLLQLIITLMLNQSSQQGLYEYR